MKKVLIIGASGLLGSAILSRLCKSESVKYYGASRNIAGDSIMMYKSHDDLLEVISYFRPNIIILAIGSPSVDYAELDMVESSRINVEEPIAIIEKVISVAPYIKFILLSSIYVYSGDEGGSCMDALVTPIPKSNYGSQKRQLEMYVENLSTNNVILRLPMVVGNSLIKTDFFNQLLNAEQSNLIIKLSNTGLRFPVDVFWVADAIDKIIRAEARGVVHLCSQIGYTKFQLAVGFLNTLGIRSNFLVASDSDEVWKRPYSLCLRNNLGYIPLNISFDLKEIASRYAGKSK